jgi:UDP-GlcNAc:undecaprenyl-phosphate GlcNAc-1-phosphate transferase
MNMVFLAALAFGVPLLINLLATPAIIAFADRFKFYDRLNARKIHTGNISRLAGIGIFMAFALGVVVVRWLVVALPPPEWRVALPLAGAALAFGIGLIDDFYELRARYKLLVQLAAAILVVLGGFVFSGVEFPGFHLGFGFAWFGYFLTFCWVLGIINAINLIDGMDGLAGGASFFAALAMGIVFFAAGCAFQGILAIALAGAIFGFLCFNRPKARIFMGDGGAYFLGFMLAFLPLVDAAPTAQPILPNVGLEGGHLGIIHAITLLLIPIGDTLAAILRRRRKGQKFSEPDRHHMHHKMLAMGLSTWQVLLVVSAIELVAAAATVYDALVGNWASAIALAGSWILVIGFFIYLDRVQYRVKTE